MGIFSDDSSNVEVSAVFPASNPLGLIVNGEQNQLLLKFVNSGTGNFTVVNAAASYHDPLKNWALVRNTTALKYNVPLPAGANYSVPFRVFSEFKPQPIGLTVWANLKDVANDEHRFVAMNTTVDVVEPAGKWFDPGLIFMYLVLAAALSGLGYFLYNTLMARFYPQTTRRKGKRALRPVVVPADQKTKAYPDVKPYEEEWIPEGLKQRKSRVGAGDRSGGEGASSAGEGASSGGEAKRAKARKGRK